MTFVPHLHHVGVQTRDLRNSIAWYRDYLGCEPTWTADRFSELTKSRLPGVSRMTEVVLGGIRFHLFERSGRVDQVNDADRIQFQHVCIAVESAEVLQGWRSRWVALFESGRYSFIHDALPTEIVVDGGLQTFYCFDVNGLEFEFSYFESGE